MENNCWGIQNGWKIVGIVFIILTLCLTVWLTYNHFKDKFYDEGFVAGVNRGQFELVKDICDDGQITLVVNNTAKTYSLNEICGR